MVKHATQVARGADRRRLLVVIAVAAAFVLPFGYTFTQFWTSSGADRTFTAEERVGVEYLGPLTKLLSALVDAQAASVQGKKPDAGTMKEAVTAVDAVHERDGDRLGTNDRWTDLKRRIQVVSGGNASGREAYAAYAQVADLAHDLIGKVGDESKLILDPELDTYYLMDAAMLRIPAVLLDAGRMADLSAIAKANPGQVPESHIVAARDRIANTVAALDTGLKKSFDATESSTLGPNLLAEVDHVRSAITPMAPSTSLIDISVSVPDPTVLAAARERVRDAAIELDEAALDELTSLLDRRSSDLDQRRLGALIAVLIAAAASAWILWSRLPDRGQEPFGAAEAGETGDRGGYPSAEPTRVVRAGEEEPEEQPELIDARRLLATGELVRVGRAVQPSRRERFRDDTE